MADLKMEREDTKQIASDAEDDDYKFRTIVDRFNSLAEVQREMKKEGVHSCGLIFGIDYTMSNRLQGQKTFGGRSLHDLSDQRANPYQQVICILGETLAPLKGDRTIPVFGFGDNIVKDKGIFPLKTEGECDEFIDVLDVYNERTPNIKLGGPTNFAPLIDKAVQIVAKTKQFHILVIVCDGQVTSEDETIDAIVKATSYPLSIVVIGVGDGPWEEMKEFDDNLPKRKFDNFQFVEFNKVKKMGKNSETSVALAALMEIPDQYQAMKQLDLLRT